MVQKMQINQINEPRANVLAEAEEIFRFAKNSFRLNPKMKLKETTRDIDILRSKSFSKNTEKQANAGRLS